NSARRGAVEGRRNDSARLQRARDLAQHGDLKRGRGVVARVRAAGRLGDDDVADGIAPQPLAMYAAGGEPAAPVADVVPARAVPAIVEHVAEIAVDPGLAVAVGQQVVDPGVWHDPGSVGRAATVHHQLAEAGEIAGGDADAAGSPRGA